MFLPHRKEAAGAAESLFGTPRHRLPIDFAVPLNFRNLPVRKAFAEGYRCGELMGDDCDSFFGLLVSYRPLALQCSHKKGRTTQSNGSASTSEERQTFVLAVPVKLLQPYLGARTYPTSVQPVHIFGINCATRPSERVAKCDEPSQL